MTSLVLSWKQEPVSPQSSEESWLSEDPVLYWTTVEQNDEKIDIEFAACDTKAEAASKLLDDLEQLEDLDDWIKEEEPYPQWLEEKMLPMFEDVEPTPVKMEPVKAATVPDTQSLLREFETVFDAVELTHGTLTPPQSPPYEPLLTTLEPLAAQSVYVIPPKQDHPFQLLSFARSSLLLPLEFPPATPQPDVARELAVVDELVRSRVEDLISNPLSPGSTCSSSSSNFGDCSSSDDPEWIPETVPTSGDGDDDALCRSPRKRSKPYARANPEDKKSRKKEQNKNAATRYRLKKKAEIEEVLEEERGLAKTNEKLDATITDLQREIKYLKNLMRELFKAKGLIN